jgi:hypothetical protein
MREATALIRMIAIGALLAAAGPLAAQETKVPSDSELVSLPGCSKGRVFTVFEAPEHEPRQTTVAVGRHFRLNGHKDVLTSIHLHEGQLIEVTGLVKKADLTGPGGIGLAGGKVRIGGPQPRSAVGNPAMDASYNNTGTIDVSAWRQLGVGCPSK